LLPQLLKPEEILLTVLEIVAGRLQLRVSGDEVVVSRRIVSVRANVLGAVGW
jgi:hypothetical protein